MAQKKRILSGVRPTGKLHWGNYFGALKNWVELQDKYECLYFVAEWGCGIYGAEEASKHYFGKHAVNLSKHEAAFLAAILPRPRFYDKRRNGPYLLKRVSIIESRL